MEITDALANGNLAEVVRALALLPTPPARVDTSGRTVSGKQAKQRLWELIENARAAAKYGDAQAEQGELEGLGSPSPSAPHERDCLAHHKH